MKQGDAALGSRIAFHHVLAACGTAANCRSASGALMLESGMVGSGYGRNLGRLAMMRVLLQYLPHRVAIKTPPGTSFATIYLVTLLEDIRTAVHTAAASIRQMVTSSR